MVITSRQHALVRAFRDAARGEGPLALVDGWHLLTDAARAGVAFDTVALAGEPPDTHASIALDTLRTAGTRIVEVTPSVLGAMSPVRTPTGVVALVLRPEADADALLARAPALLVVAVDMQDPGNVGALLRAAEAGGATGVAFVGDSADPWSWKALRAAMGSTFRIPVLRERDGLALCGRLRHAGTRLTATAPSGGTSIYEADFSGPVAFLLGGEGPGLTEHYRRCAEAVVTIPMQDPVESLNVAVAGALLVYEASRQRGTAGPAIQP